MIVLPFEQFQDISWEARGVQALEGWLPCLPANRLEKHSGVGGAG